MYHEFMWWISDELDIQISDDEYFGFVVEDLRWLLVAQYRPRSWTSQYCDLRGDSHKRLMERSFQPIIIIFVIFNILKQLKALTFWMMASCGIKSDVWACLMASLAKLAPSSPTGCARAIDRHTNKHKTTFILLLTTVQRTSQKESERLKSDNNNFFLISFQYIGKYVYVNFTFLVLI